MQLPTQINRLKKDACLQVYINYSEEIQIEMIFNFYPVVSFHFVDTKLFKAQNELMKTFQYSFNPHNQYP